MAKPKRGCRIHPRLFEEKMRNGWEGVLHFFGAGSVTKVSQGYSLSLLSPPKKTTEGFAAVGPSLVSYTSPVSENRAAIAAHFANTGKL